MKSSKIIFALLVITGVGFVSCKKEENKGTQVENKAQSKTVAKAEKTTFTIEGMTCAMGCAKTIETKLSGLEGVQKANVDFEKKTATVEYDAGIQSPEKIAEVVEAVADGQTYKVSNVKSSANKAMLYQEKEKKTGKKTKNSSSEASVVNAPASKNAGTKEGEKKGSCCAGKKACSAEKPSTM